MAVEEPELINARIELQDLVLVLVVGDKGLTDLSDDERTLCNVIIQKEGRTVVGSEVGS